MHRLLSFLGASAHTAKENRYQEVRYRFAQSTSAACEFFGLALLNDLKPDQFTILGTTGSMWDVLGESLGLQEGHGDLHERVYDASCEDSFDQSLADEWAQALQPALQIPIVFKVIPYGYNESEQLEILNSIAENIQSDDSVSIDITHGMRHLPMLAQMSALYLTRVRRASIHGIYYGAFERTENGVCPVFNLAGLLQIADWSDAVSAYNRDHNYSVFSPLLQDTHPKTASMLSEAAFDERNLRFTAARSSLSKIPAEITDKPLQGVAGFMQEDLLERIQWHEGKGDYLQQRQLAINFLETGDYLRATLYAFEAFITRLHELQPHRTRDDVKDFFEKDTNPEHNPDWPAYESLRALRNVLAHGDQKKSMSRARDIQSEEKLNRVLRQSIKKLLPESNR